MLVDAAKQGDVEIPYFCYEPKLGEPVGACRMCLVEIEGIPKLQTSCSTPVRDGMVVNTQTDRVSDAQNAIVEFLLVNHPLDCPVCDKGGECPLQDITFGWGLGRTRVIEPKRHFDEAARAVAADRDRPRALHPLLSLRALQPGDRRGLAADLHRARRAHLRRHPRRPSVRGAVQRQHHRALPGRRADLAAVPLPRAAVGHRGRRRHLHALPLAVQRRPSPCATTRSCACSPATHAERRRRLAVRQGPLRLPGDPRRRADHATAGPRRRRAAPGLLGAALETRRPDRRHKGRVGALVGGQATNEEGFLLQRLLREGARLARHRLTPRPARVDRGARPGARRPGAAGVRPRPRVRAHGAGARLRAARRRADPRPADPQGRPPQRRQAGDRHRAAERA